MIDPDGREVVFDFESWLHLASGTAEELSGIGSTTLRVAEADLAPALKSAA